MDKNFWIQVVSFLFLVIHYGHGKQIVTGTPTEYFDDRPTPAHTLKEEGELANISMYDMRSLAAIDAILESTDATAIDNISLIANST